MSSRYPRFDGEAGTGDHSLLEAPALPKPQRMRLMRVPCRGGDMSRAEEFRARCQCRTYKDMPKAMLFGPLGEQREALSKGIFSHILAVARVKASRQCRDAIQTGCRISRILRVKHGVHGSGVTSESGRSARNIGGGSGGVSILNSSVTHVLVSDSVVRFGMSEQINLTKAGGLRTTLESESRQL